MAINGGNANRQKMINLMYIVFIAMMALKVSSDVLDGYDQIEEKLEESLHRVEAQNAQLRSYIEHSYAINSLKASDANRFSLQLEAKTKSLMAYIDEIKSQIVSYADGSGNTSPQQLKNKDNTEAPAQVLLAPISGKAGALADSLNAYSQFAQSYGGGVLENPSLERVDIEWFRANFSKVTTVAALALLSQLQADIKLTEGQALTALMTSLDQDPFHMNKLQAMLVPDSRFVIQGDRFTAKVLVAAVDTTQRPEVSLSSGSYSREEGLVQLQTTTLGDHTLRGEIKVVDKEGNPQVYPVETSYTVVAPIATVTPTMMNVLYSGIENPIKVSFPGISDGDLLLQTDKAKVTKVKDGWSIKPELSEGEITISISAKSGDGKIRSLGKNILKVRPLPTPAAYLSYNSGKGQSPFRGGRMAKSSLLQASNRLGAAIDDGLLDIQYRVDKFTLISFDSMGNAILEISNGDKFSEAQLRLIQSARKNTRLFITNIIAKGPEGISPQNVSPIEIIVQ